MDARDVELLGALIGEPLASYQALGRRIGVGGGAAKARLDRMRDDGVYAGTLLIPVPQAFGREARVLRVTHEDPLSVHPDAVGTILDSPGASIVIIYAAPGESVPGSSPFHLPATPKPGRLPLSPLDWRVIDALMVDPRATVRALAQTTGLAESTVRGHRASLLADGILHVHPLLQPSRARGLLLYTLRARVADAAAARALRSALGDATQLYATHGNTGFLASSPDRAHMHAVQARAAAVPGVSHIEVDARDQDGGVALDRLRAMVRDEIARWSLARRA